MCVCVCVCVCAVPSLVHFNEIRRKQVTDTPAPFKHQLPHIPDSLKYVVGRGLLEKRNCKKKEEEKSIVNDNMQKHCPVSCAGIHIREK